MTPPHIDDEAIAAAAAQLRRYGYLRPRPPADTPPTPGREPAPTPASEPTASDERSATSDFNAALTEYQRRHALPVTRTLDAATRAHLSLSRCGWVDDTDTRRRLRIEAFPPVSARELGDGPIELEWFLSPIPFATPDPAGVAQAVAAAFAKWEAAAPVRFPRQTQAGAARVLVSFAPIDGSRGVLGSTVAGGPMQLDSGEVWSLTDPATPGANADVLTIALHEIGHVLNIGDHPDPNAVMHGFFGNGPAVIRREFTEADRQAIRDRFGTTT